MAVTILPVPAFDESNVAVPPEIVRSSPGTASLTVRLVIVAALVPSYALLATVKPPCAFFLKMLASVVSVVEAGV